MNAFPWIGALALLNAVAASSETVLPKSPDEIRCPPGATRERSEVGSSIRIWCRRADGLAIGPHTEWYLDGRLSRFSTYAPKGEHTAEHGLDVAFQPDGSKLWLHQWDHGSPEGEWVGWYPDGVRTRLYEHGILIDVFRGRQRPPFSCPHGLIPRVRTTDPNNSLGWPGGSRPPHTFIEFWCEDPEEPALLLPRDDFGIPRKVRCQVTSHGIVSFVAAYRSWGRTERLPLPPGVESPSAAAIAELCERSDFWRMRRREGPYISRGEYGEPHEEGRYVRGRRHGIFRVMGHACVRWEHGERMGRVHCPMGPVLEPDPWVAERWDDLAHRAAALGWAPLEAGGAEGRELRIWRYAGPTPGYVTRVGGEGLRVLRLLLGPEGASGEIAAFDVTEDARQICGPDRPETCRFHGPSDRSWEDVAWELDLLDAWSLPPAEAFRIPEVAHGSFGNRRGFFLETRVGENVTRDWYGPARHISFPRSHQTEGIIGLVDSLWSHHVRFPKIRLRVLP